MLLTRNSFTIVVVTVRIAFTFGRGRRSTGLWCKKTLIFALRRFSFPSGVITTFGSIRNCISKSAAETPSVHWSDSWPTPLHSGKIGRLRLSSFVNERLRIWRAPQIYK